MPKIGSRIELVDPGVPLEDLYADLQQTLRDIKEAEEAIRPYANTLNKLVSERIRLEWAIYAVKEIERLKAIGKEKPSTSDPWGCPSDFRGSWGQKKKKRQPAAPKKLAGAEEAL